MTHLKCDSGSVLSRMSAIDTVDFRCVGSSSSGLSVCGKAPGVFVVNVHIPSMASISDVGIVEPVERFLNQVNPKWTMEDTFLIKFLIFSSRVISMCHLKTLVI